MFAPNLAFNPTQIVTTALTTTSTSMTVTAGTGILMPSGLFYARLGGISVNPGSIEYITAFLSGTDTFTIVRNVDGDNGAVLQAWPTGTIVQAVTRVGSSDVLGEFVSALAAQTSGGASSLPVLKSNTAVATITGGTLATAGLSITRTNPAAAITGVIMQSGSIDGQLVIVENIAIAANTVTFAAVGTSHVADGVSSSVAGLTSSVFIWDATAGYWTHIKAA